MCKWVRSLVLAIVILGGTYYIQSHTYEVDGIIGDYYTQPDGRYLVACELDDGSGAIYNYYSDTEPTSDYITVMMQGNKIMDVKYRDK